MNKQELLILIDKYLAGEASGEEVDLLSRYYNSFQQNGQWSERELGAISDTESKLFKRIQEKIHQGQAEVNKPVAVREDDQRGKVLPLKLRSRLFMFTRVAAAASVVGLIILGTYFWFSGDAKKEVATTKITNKRFKSDVLPGGDKALLTLADGSAIELDKVQDGALAEQGNTQVIKQGSKLAYHSVGIGANKLLYNTLSTPRGGQYQVILPDGSKVWLNAASVLRYPTAFTGKERKVEIAGEAYFEVAKNKALPFVVQVQGAEVQVLGTHFNVMAYNEEDAVKTTLLEGSVKFVKGYNASMLKPGQQAQLSHQGQIKVISGVAIDQVVAWKNGYFDFKGADIGVVTRQLSRWYDVDIVYHKKVMDLFYAEIPRNTKLSDVLKALELTGKVKFDIEGKKIIVMP